MESTEATVLCAIKIIRRPVIQILIISVEFKHSGQSELITQMKKTLPKST